MKYRYYLLLLLLSLSISVSCDNIADNNCSGVICDAPMFTVGLDYIDAESGENLLFGEDTSYSIDDLSAESIESNREYFVNVDSTFTDEKIALIYGSVSDNIKLTLGDLSTDTLYVNALYRDIGCCGEVVLMAVHLNEEVVCTDCKAPTVVKILK